MNRVVVVLYIQGTLEKNLQNLEKNSEYVQHSYHDHTTENLMKTKLKN
jgi:hypothetical protein